MKDIWKTTDQDTSSDPFFIDNSKTERITKKPEPSLYKKEENPVLSQLIYEAELGAQSYHQQLKFYEIPWVAKEDLATYTQSQAEEILRTKSLLNPEQIAAALSADKDLHIHALAGTGKTSLLSSTIAYLLATGADPKKMAISSHTVTAAAEIESRIWPVIQSLFPETNLDTVRPTTGTIHSIAYRELILHKHPKHKWTIIDDTQQTNIWEEAIHFANPNKITLDKEDKENIPINLRLVDRIRNFQIPEQDIPEIVETISQDRLLRQTTEIYCKIKEARKLLDYTDLLREWTKIIVHPAYKNRWDYFFVDEFQDTNPLQKFILKLLKLQGTTLIVCGDSRQSINSFNGSDPTSHSSFFEKIGMKELWLETNYRCSKEIINCANRVLSLMNPPEKGRLNASSNASQGEKPKLIFTRRIGDNRKWLSPEESEIEAKRENRISCKEAIKLYERLKKEGISFPSVALLYRTNIQGAGLEEALAEINGSRKKEGLPLIPYSRKDYRKTALRTRTEKEVLSILKIWCSPETANWEQILRTNYFYGIGEVTAKAIQRKAEKKKPKTIAETIELFDKELNARNIETIGSFIEAWEEACGQNPPEQINPEAACRCLTKWIDRESSRRGTKKENEENQKRSYQAAIFEKVLRKASQYNIGLKTAIEETEKDVERNNQLQAFSNKALGLQISESSLEIEKEEGIILSTIHLSKGREYDGVVLHQLTKGSLPHWNAIKFWENPKHERERRFRKYVIFAKQERGPIPWSKIPLPLLTRKLFKKHPANTPEQAWEDYNHPIEEELRLLYVAITRAKTYLTITARDYNYEFLPKEIWETFDRYRIK